MHTSIAGVHLAGIASVLDNEELGAAIRILSRIASTGRPVPLDRARVISQMDLDRWTESKDLILEHFRVEDGMVGHACLDEGRYPPVASSPQPRTGRTAEMPIVHREVRPTVPVFACRSQPERISMKRTAYMMATEIFTHAGQSESTARSVLASLLKNWPEGAVYEALSSAHKQGSIADPRGWIVRHLQRNARPTVSSRQKTDVPPPARASRRQIVTAESAGVSQRTADSIRERNANLRIDLGASETLSVRDGAHDPDEEFS